MLNLKYMTADSMSWRLIKQKNKKYKTNGEDRNGNNKRNVNRCN